MKMSVPNFGGMRVIEKEELTILRDVKKRWKRRLPYMQDKVRVRSRRVANPRVYEIKLDSGGTVLVMHPDIAQALRESIPEAAPE